MRRTPGGQRKSQEDSKMGLLLSTQLGKGGPLLWAEPKPMQSVSQDVCPAFFVTTRVRDSKVKCLSNPEHRKVNTIMFT